MKKILSTITLLWTLLIVAACQEVGTMTPQEPMWDKEPCARCRMVLSEKRYAVQRILNNGEIHFYDDLNCTFGHGHHKDDGKLYVRPYGGENWVPAEDVKYVGGLRTPMNSGHGAVLEGGTITFEELQHKFKE